MFNSKLKYTVHLLKLAVLKMIRVEKVQSEINHLQDHINEKFEEEISQTQEVVIDLIKHLGLEYKIVDGKKVLGKKEIVKEKKKK